MSTKLFAQKWGLYIGFLTIFTNPGVVQWQRLSKVFGKQYFRRFESSIVHRGQILYALSINRDTDGFAANSVLRMGWESPAETSNNPFLINI